MKLSTKELFFLRSAIENKYVTGVSIDKQLRKSSYALGYRALLEDIHRVLEAGNDVLLYKYGDKNDRIERGGKSIASLNRLVKLFICKEEDARFHYHFIDLCYEYITDGKYKRTTYPGHIQEPEMSILNSAILIKLDEINHSIMAQSVHPTSKTTASHPQNRVLQSTYQPSENFFHSDLILKHFLQTQLSKEGYAYMEDKWIQLGHRLALEMDALSQLADKNGPELVRRDPWGNTINEIRFHPAYQQLMEIAVESEMFRVKWQPELRQKFGSESHRLGFGSAFLYAMGEGGIPCPLCMTDGVARLIDRYADKEDRERLLPHIYTDKAGELFTGAMFLTEKAGGSDVGANLVSATRVQGDYYQLNGEKWFCSNANAEIIFALARTHPEIRGTRGLSIFLLEKQKPDGSKNEMDVVRLKDKLGVRSMASAECILTDTWGKRIGDEGMGFKIMADMVNLSRLYNASAALSFMRRALIEAYQFLSHRKTFGKIALEHALVRDKLAELGSMYVRNFYLTWHCILTLDLADQGDQHASQIIRFLTPMVKKATAQDCVYLIRECMELMGGMGYIEDGVMPKLMRDAMVLPIWEGAGNIMVLDMLRASYKSKGLQMVLKEIRQGLKNKEFQQQLSEVENTKEDMLTKDPDKREMIAKRLFEKVTYLYQLTLLNRYKDDQSNKWIEPSFNYARETLLKPTPNNFVPLDTNQLSQLMGWQVP